MKSLASYFVVTEFFSINVGLLHLFPKIPRLRVSHLSFSFFEIQTGRICDPVFSVVVYGKTNSQETDMTSSTSNPPEGGVQGTVIVNTSGEPMTVEEAKQIRERLGVASARFRDFFPKDRWGWIQVICLIGVLGFLAYLVLSRGR